jgi:peptidoglycan hydrolase CwlO-like protein
MEDKIPNCLCGHCIDKEQIIDALEKKLKDRQTELDNRQTELDNLRDSHEELWEKYKQLQSELLFRGLKINRF